MRKRTTTTTRHRGEDNARRGSLFVTGLRRSTLAMTIACVMLAASCAKDDTANGDGNAAVRFTASAAGPADVATRADNLTLAAGGEVTVQIGTGADAQTAVYTLTAAGTEWALTPKTATDVLYLKQYATTAAVTAWGTLNYGTGQSAPAIFTNASAAVTWNGSTPNIALAFKPASACVEVTVLGSFGETAPVDHFTATVNAAAPEISSGLYQWNTAGATPVLSASTTATAVTFAADGEAQGEIAPVVKAAGETLLTLTAGNDASAYYAGKTYYVRVPSGGYTFAAGNRYLMEVQLGDGAEATVKIVEIAPFGDGGTIYTDDAVIRTPEQMAAFLGDAATAFADSGTDALREALMKNWTRMGAVRLGADIDMADVRAVDEAAVKAASAMYFGNGHSVVFDGMGFALKGLTARLFLRIIAGSEVRNLQLTGVDIDVSLVSVGAVVGNNFGTVRNVAMKGTVKGVNYVGGIAGSNYGAIIDCSAGINSTITSSGGEVGGIVGVNNEGGSIIGCTTGEGTKVKANSINNGDIGGIVGWNIRALVLDCRSEAESVTGWNYIGGIAGRNTGGTVAGCSMDGTTVSAGGGSVGGIAGENRANATIVGCSVGANSTVSGTQEVGGIAGSNSYSSMIVGSWSAAASVSGVARAGGIVGSNSYEATVDGCGWVTGTGALATDVGLNEGGTVGVTFGVATADAMHTHNNAAKMNAAIAAIYPSLPAAARAGKVWWDLDEDGKLTLVAANPGLRIMKGISTPEELRAFAADWNAAYVNGNRAATYAAQYAVLQDWADGDATWGGNATGDADAPRGTVRLLADIDLGDAAWTPIGTQEPGIAYAGFSGTFDGRRAYAAADAVGHECNYKITGLAVSNVREAGLFSKVAPGGTVSNVTVEGSMSGTEIAGGILNWNNGGTISGCFFKGDVSTTGMNTNAGGIAADNRGTVTGCGYLGGTVSGDGTYGNGGIVGYNLNATVTLCYSLADAVTATGTTYRGGIVGYNFGTASSSFWLKADGNDGQPGVAEGYPSGTPASCLSNNDPNEVVRLWRTAMGQP